MRAPSRAGVCARPRARLAAACRYEAGSLCTPDDCSALIDAFPLAIAGQNAPEETGSYYYFGYLVFHEILLMGFAEIFRTGLQPFGEAEKIPNPFPELEGAPKSYPGGRFDPFGMVDKCVRVRLSPAQAWLACRAAMPRNRCCATAR